MLEMPFYYRNAMDRVLYEYCIGKAILLLECIRKYRNALESRGMRWTGHFSIGMHGNEFYYRNVLERNTVEKPLNFRNALE